jgi:hypothetical protein
MRQFEVTDACLRTRAPVKDPKPDHWINIASP